MLKLLLVSAFIPTLIFSQSRKERKALEVQQKADQVVIDNLKNHIHALATSSPTEQSNESTESKAVEYISGQFKSLGLQPKGTNGFIQAFKVDDGKGIDPATFLKVNDKQLEVNTDYFPLPYSAEKKVKGKPAMALRERGVPWFVDLKDWFDDGSKIQGNNLDDLIKKEATKVLGKGATALFLYNSGSINDGLTYDKKDKSAALALPVIYITPAAHKKYFNDHSDVLDIELNVAFRENALKGNNLIGYINNSAPSTIAITAHYARVNVGPTKATSTGADDNGSGVAMLIELARMLSASKAKNNNYAFIAFGGADGGSLASNYWIENTNMTTPINCVFNLDMVGSYDEGKKLFIQGYNTSPAWNETFTSAIGKKVEISIDSVGTATDLNASFYKKGIPGLSFSSALHEEYSAKPDEEGKINYAGELQIAKFINRLVEATDSKGKVAFSKNSQLHTPAAKPVEQTATKLVSSAEPIGGTPKTTVSLGVIPDKNNSEPGLKISAVSPKKLASKIGLQPGDVITNLGTFVISDLKTYIQALSNFKAGDKTTLRIKRGKDDKEFPVEF